MGNASEIYDGSESIFTQALGFLTWNHCILQTFTATFGGALDEAGAAVPAEGNITELPGRLTPTRLTIGNTRSARNAGYTVAPRGRDFRSRQTGA